MRYALRPAGVEPPVGECGALLQRGLVEREGGADAHRVALPATDPPATAQRFADLGDLGGIEMFGEQAGHVDGVRLLTLGRLLPARDVGGHAVEFLQDVAHIAGTGRIQHPADGLGRDVVLPGERLHRGALGIRVNDVGSLILVERGRTPQRLARSLGGGDAFLRVLRDHVVWNSRTPASMVTNSLVCGSSAARSKRTTHQSRCADAGPAAGGLPGSG